MQKLDDSVQYVLNPEVRFRNDNGKCFLYTVDSFFHSVENLTVMTPLEVILLLLFEDGRTIEEVSTSFSYVVDFQGDEGQAKLFTMNSLNNILERTNYDALLVNRTSLEPSIIKESISRYDVSDFIIPKDNVKFCPRDLRLSIPLSVNYNVSTECGFHCVYCYHPLVPVKDYISLERLDRIFAELKAGGCESFMLTGGDPMLRPDIIEIMELLHKHGIYYSLSTKSILSKEKIIRMHDAGLDRIQLSIDSSTPQIVSNLLGVGLQYVDQFATMVRDFISIGVEVRLKMVLSSYNVEGLAEFLQWIKDLGVNRLHVVAYGRSGARHQDSTFPTEKQMKEATAILWKFKNENPNFILEGGNSFEIGYNEPIDIDPQDKARFFSKRAICNAGRFSMTMLPNGEVFVCEQLPYDQKYVLGDLRVQSVYECWNGERMQAWLSPPSREVFPVDSPCRSCEESLYQECHKLYSRCLRYIREFTGTTEGPDTKCPFATFPKTRIV